jgi:hypothetical protein
MTLTEGLLIVLVIILMFNLFKGGCSVQKEEPKEEKTYECKDKSTGAVTMVRITPEQRAMEERAEEFKHENFRHEDFSPKSLAAAKNQMLGLDGDHTFGTEGFMSESADFTDYIMGQAVDQQVQKNHTEFVKDRMGGASQLITGRTYAIADEIETDSTPWMGLRRPQAVPTDGNTQQVTDNNPYGYSAEPTFTWKSR